MIVILDQVKLYPQTKISGQLGLDSHRGRVRRRNEDFCLSFRQEGFLILLVADGVGGMPEGQRASILACRQMKLSLGHYLSCRPFLAPAQMLSQALAQTQMQMAKLAQKMGVHNGLRSTLIAVVIDELNQVCHYLYIGDGALFVSTPERQLYYLLQPMKGERLNFLTGSLGPTPHGEAVYGQYPLQPGDVLFFGTDGVFDRVEHQTFAQSLIDSLPQRVSDMSLQKLVSQTLCYLAEYQEQGDFVFDDNLTLGVYILMEGIA